MTQFKKDFIETLKNAVDIVAEISEVVELKQSGENFVGLCPFHEESNASFTVYPETQTWHCFGCNKSGDIISFIEEKEQLSFRDALLRLAEKYNVPIPEETEPEGVDVIDDIRRTSVEFYHSVLFREGAEALAYLTEVRGLREDVIRKFQIGYAAGHTDLKTVLKARGFKMSDAEKAGVLKQSKDYFTGGYIIFPNICEGRIVGLQGRAFPEGSHPKYLMEKGEITHLIGEDVLKNNPESVIITEGWMDFLSVYQAGFENVVALTGAGGLKQKWVTKFKNIKTIYLGLDNDNAGQNSSRKYASFFGQKAAFPNYLAIREKDWNDIFVRECNKDVTAFRQKIENCLINAESQRKVIYNELQSKFSELGVDELYKVLSLTVTGDKANSVIIFLACILAYTERNQLNVAQSGPSSTGKSYVPLEISKLFPSEDLVKLGGASPTSFFHDQGVYIKDENVIRIDLERKIIIFKDMPNYELLKNLRSLLSKDEKEVLHKITSKDRTQAIRTKNVLLIGFPSVVFCSTFADIDEQESTRFIFLSPEISDEKISRGVTMVLDREANPSVYKTIIEEDKERMLLKEQIEVIKKAQIDDVLIHPEEKKKIEALFYGFNLIKKPRDMRDIGTFTSLVKGFALLNFMHRESEGRNIFVNQKDVESGYSLWQEIAFFQEMGMPPYIFSIYKDVILPAFREKNNIPEGFTDFESKNGLKIQEILNAHYQHFHTYLTERKLRREILPMLVTARLITEGTDNDDKRAKVVFPVAIDRKQYIPSGARGSKKTDEISEKYYVNVPDVPSPQEADEGLLIIEDK